MSTLLIEGGHRLSGTVAVAGNKNAALPLLAACLLTTEECVLTNVPRIGDVEVMAGLLRDLGPTVTSMEERDALPPVDDCVARRAEPDTGVRRHAIDAFTRLLDGKKD